MDEIKKRAKEEFEEKILKALLGKGYKYEEQWYVDAVVRLKEMGFTEKEIRDFENNAYDTYVAFRVNEKRSRGFA